MGVWIETAISLVAWKHTQSHPVWVCGSKPLSIYPAESQVVSHPVWVCGLKHRYGFYIQNSEEVTPCMGVWIETCRSAKRREERDVTPCMGVWIETQTIIISARRIMTSHPVWVCGLKHNFNNLIVCQFRS